MARLESQAAMGTFPLDDWRIEQLGNLIKNIKSQNGSVIGRIFDPFADTGETVKALADKWNLEPYAVELKEDAAREAQEKLGVGNAIWADCYTGIVASNASMDVLYLNPPYDMDYSDMESRRSEYKALRHHWKYLRYGGVVIWVAYKQHITNKVARFLLENTKAIFPFYWAEKHLGQYTQVCIVAVKKDSEKQEPFSPNFIEKAVQHLVSVGERDVEKKIDIEESRFIEMSEGITQDNFKKPMCNYKYIVGHREIRNKHTGEVKKVVDSRIAIQGTPMDNMQFRRKEADIPLLEKVHNDYGVHKLNGFNEFFRINTIDEQDDTPIAKPRTGQLGLIIASGMLNQVTMRHNDKLCMIRGSVKQKEFTAHVTEEMDTNNNAATVTTVHRMPTPVVTILYEDGTVENLTEEDALVDFIGQHMSQLLEIYEKKYKPAYDMQIHPEWGKVFDTNLIKGKHEYLPTQEYYSVATAEQLLRNGKIVNVAEMSFGKAQPLDAKVLTPDGWSRMGKINVGDKVIAANGCPANVVGVFDQGEQDTYRITFNDGSSTECNKEHLWNVITPLNKWKGEDYKTLTLQEIMDKPLSHSNGNLQNYIPIVQPVHFNEVNHDVITPYVLGVLIGDGGLTGELIRLSNPDDDVIKRFSNELPDGYELIYSGKSCDYRIRSNEKPNVIRLELERLNLMGKYSHQKHIPNEYLYDSYKNRMALLQGLMDTDGTVGTSGTTPTFTTTSKKLARGMKELCRSLGMIVNITERVTQYTHDNEIRDGRKSYRLTMRTITNPFYMARKSGRFTEKRYRFPTRAIKSIEFIGRKNQKCIAIDDASKLYVTDDYIVTHNTACAIATLEMLYRFERGKEAM